MPGSNYPDGANLYIAEAVRATVRAAGHATPIVAAGKIGTLALAEKVLERGQGDMIGMARALLADPDLPKKWKSGGEDRVVRCVYGNVCKALDENFRRVDCTLWPKRLGQAPESEDTIAPTWQEGGPQLTVEYKDGRVLLRWRPATDNEVVYGYQIFRDADDGNLMHYASVRGGTARFEDARVIGGAVYFYAVRPYDLAGNRGPMSETLKIAVPNEHVPPAEPYQLPIAKDPGAVEGCTGSGA
jgi:hypothetical protein